MEELLISQERSDQLLAEARELLEEMEQSPPSVGDAEVVAFTEEFAEENEIGAFGRMTVKAGETRFFAAPRVLDRRVYFEMDEHNFLDWAKKWSRGDRADVPLDKMMKGPALPRMVKEKPRNIFYTYERQLLLRLLHYDEVTLFNPSCKTMSVLLSAMMSFGMRTGYVRVTASLQHHWAKEILDFIEQSDGRLELLEEGCRGIGYLGTNSPLIFPDRWVRLIPSPFLDPNWSYGSYSLNYSDDRVLMSYERKKGYTSYNSLLRDPQALAFNPETVDEYLEMGKRSQQMFFMETTEDLVKKTKDDRKVFHTPWFVDADGHWVVMNGLEWKVRGNLVVDCRGEGTYLSRRQVYSPPEGFSWVSLERSGTHWLTYSSSHPHRARDVNVYYLDNAKVVALGDVQLVRRVEKVIPQGGWHYCYRDDLAVGDDGIPLMGDDLFMTRVVPRKALSFVFQTMEGLVFGPNTLHKDGLWYVPDMKLSSQFSPYLAGGRVTYVSIFRTPVGNYVDLPEKPLGESFILSRMSDIIKMVHNLTMLSPKYQTFREVFSPVMDPDQGGTVSMVAPAHRLHTLLQIEMVDREGDDVSTVAQYSSQLDKSCYFVYDFLSRSRIYSVWRPDDVVNTQFVLTENVRIKLPGKVEQGYINGLTWGQTCLDLGRRTELRYRGRPPVSYLWFLRRNFASVKVTYLVTGETALLLYRLK